MNKPIFRENIGQYTKNNNTFISVFLFLVLLFSSQYGSCYDYYYNDTDQARKDIILDIVGMWKSKKEEILTIMVRE